MSNPAQSTDSIIPTSAPIYEDPLAGVTPIIDNDFDTDFDIFDEEFGGQESGIEDLYRVKFNAGINENVKFLGFEWSAAENYKLIKAKFENFDQWQEDFSMFVPEEKTYTDKSGAEVTSWFPKKMYDSQGMPIENDADHRRRNSGGVPVVDPSTGRAVRDAATKKMVYRNETEDEARIRKIKEFKQKLNSFLAAYCRETMKPAMEFIASKGRITGWKDYMDRIIEALDKFCPNYQSMNMRLKLHRKYDKTTSNKLSEKYLELPESLGYGLFLEQMCESDKSVITTTAYEEKSRIEAPTDATPTAGLQMPGSPKGLPGMPGVAAGMPGLPGAVVKTAMPGLPK